MAETAVSTSMSDSIRAAMKEVSEKEPNEERTDNSVQEDRPDPARGVGDANDASAANTAEERARDKAGRFASAETPADKQQRETLTLKPKETKDAAKEPERAKPNGGSAGAGAVQVAAQPAGSEPGIAGKPRESVGPPPHWNGAAKIDWNKIPGALRESIAKDYEAVGKAQGLVSVLQPYEQRLARDFGGTDRGIAAIMGTWDYAQAQPLAFMRDFCNKYGIDPQQLSGGVGRGQQPVQAYGQEQQGDPGSDFMQWRQQVDTALQQIAQQPVIQQHQQVLSEVQQFQTALNPDGSVAHPYFADVASYATQILQTPELQKIKAERGRTAALKEAYDQACWATPNVREAILKDREATREAERRQAIERAQGAAVSVSGSPGVNGHPQRQAQSVSDELRSVMRAAKGGRA